jgi:Domain of unknown function (DUF4395)
MLDPRGPRFAAAVTSTVLVVILALSATPVAGWLAAAQAVVFAIGAFDPRRTPYGWAYRTFVAPRLGPPSEREPAAPVRFAQGLGFVFVVVAAVGYLSGATLLGVVATGFALAAAFLNAAFGLCLGCELYLLLRRMRTRTS